jgi:hypothetical protein
VRITAQVRTTSSGSSITIVAVVPESPFAAFDTESTVLRGAFNAADSCIIQGPFRPPPGVLQDSPGLIQEGVGTWAADSTAREYRATVTETGKTFSLRHDNTPIGVTYRIVHPITTFEYQLRFVSP